MPKLHELLAVEGQLKDQAKKTRSDIGDTFAKKRHLFEEKITTFQSSEEGKPPVTEQQSDIQSTIRKEIDWLKGIWAKALDTSLQVADANTQAKADIILDNGGVILQNVPVTALLELEKRAGEIQDLVAAIPTLDPAKGFKPDTDRGGGIYRARDHVTSRTKKMQKPIVLFGATKEHPAQTQLITEDVPIGRVTVHEWSGLVTPAEKADLLERSEELRRAIKQARARANELETPPAKARSIGEKLFDFVFGKD